jgi:hypothetical protein
LCGESLVKSIVVDHFPGFWAWFNAGVVFFFGAVFLNVNTVIFCLLFLFSFRCLYPARPLLSGAPSALHSSLFTHQTVVNCSYSLRQDPHDFSLGKQDLLDN